MADVGSDFPGFGPLPDQIVDGHTVSYVRHHVISREAVGASKFLQALVEAGMWNQENFATNGAPLVSKIDGVTASDSPYRNIVAGAMQTGGHPAYNASQNRIFAAFDDAYFNAKATGNWGSHGSERAWLAAQAPKIEGLAALLKVELRNPDSALKLHTSDTNRIDLSSKEIWGRFDAVLFDGATLSFRPAVTEHFAYQAAANSPLGAALFSAVPGSGSPLDINGANSLEGLRASFSEHYGLQRWQPSFFDRVNLRNTLDIVDKGRADKLILGLMVGGVFALIFKTQDAMAAERGQSVSFNEARVALGIEITSDALYSLAGEIGLTLGARTLIPYAIGKQLFDLMLSGEDVIALVHLYASVFPESAILNGLNEVAVRVEHSSSYAFYKTNKEFAASYVADVLKSGAGLFSSLSSLYSAYAAPDAMGTWLRANSNQPEIPMGLEASESLPGGMQGLGYKFGLGDGSFVIRWINPQNGDVEYRRDIYNIAVIKVASEEITSDGKVVTFYKNGAVEATRRFDLSGNIVAEVINSGLSVLERRYLPGGLLDTELVNGSVTRTVQRYDDGSILTREREPNSDTANPSAWLNKLKLAPVVAGDAGTLVEWRGSDPLDRAEDGTLDLILGLGKISVDPWSGSLTFTQDGQPKVTGLAGSTVTYDTFGLHLTGPWFGDLRTLVTVGDDSSLSLGFEKRAVDGTATGIPGQIHLGWPESVGITADADGSYSYNLDGSGNVLSIKPNGSVDFLSATLEALRTWGVGQLNSVLQLPSGGFSIGEVVATNGGGNLVEQYTLDPITGERAAPGKFSAVTAGGTWFDTVAGSQIGFDGTKFTVLTPNFGTVSFDGNGAATFQPFNGASVLYNFTAGALTGIGSAPGGLGVLSLMRAAAGMTSEVVFDPSSWTATVKVGGGTVLTVPSGSGLSVVGGLLTTQTTKDGWVNTYTLDGSSTTFNMRSLDGSASVTFRPDPITGELRPISAIFDGRTYQNTSASDWLITGQYSLNLQDTSSGFTTTSGQISASQSSIFNGDLSNLTGEIADLVALSKLFDGAEQTSEYLGNRLANGSVGDAWYQYYIGPPPNATTSPVSGVTDRFVDPALAQAQRQIMATWTQPIPTPHIWIIDVRVSFNMPLVLDLDGNGVDLVSRDQSSADFDIDSNGTRERVSWVGKSDGILVFDKNGNGRIDDATEWFGEQFSKDGTTPVANQKGFSALATLATAGATVFSAETSLVNAVTGRRYFDEVQVWVDANQNGVNDAGELRGLTALGIKSIDLTATDVNRVVNGNIVVATGSYTSNDGTRHVISDVGLTDKPGATRQAPSMSAATLAFAEFVSKGLAAQASGQAQAASAAMAVLPVGFAAEIAAMQSRMVERRIVINGQSSIFDPKVTDFTQINFLGWPGQSPLQRGGVPLPVPQQVIAALNAISSAMNAVRAAADAVASGTSAMAIAQAAGLAADLDSSAIRVSDANAKASQSSAAWGNSIAALLNANSALIAAGNLINSASALLAQIVPSNYNTTGNVQNGASYANPIDAYLASDAFAALESGLKSFAAAKDAMQKLLGALGVSGNYGTVLFGGNGSSQTAGNDRTLFMAGAGSQTFVGGASHDDFLLTPSAGAVTIHNFATGTNGDTLQFLNVGHVVVGDNGQGGTTLSYGAGQSVNLIGVAPGQLDLLANIVGVDTISFAAAQTGGTRSLQGAPVFYDGQIHVRNIVGSDRGDTLIGDQGANRLIGGSGNDILIGHGGGDVLDGRGGTNTASYAWSSSGVGIDLVTGKDTYGDQLYNINNVTGSVGADVITGDGANNVIDGGAGDDLITGGGGNDVYLFGRGSGRDIIVNGVSLNGVPSGKLKLGAAVAADELWFERSGNDLIIRLLGRADSATVRGWFSNGYSQLQAIALASGFEMGTVAINSAIASFAAYQAAHPDFNPASAVALPSGISISSQFLPPTDPPGVPQASNVALATEQAYQTGAAAQAASTMASWGSSLSGSYNALVGAENSANSWIYAGKVPNAPFGQPGQRAYLMQTAQYPGTTFLAVGTYGPQSTWTWYQEISSLTSTTFYIKKTVTFNVSQILVSANWHPEWVAGDMPWDGNSMIDAASAISQTRALLSIAPAAAQAISAAGSARNAALGAAVAANRASAAWSSTEAISARSVAQASESSFAAAIANYLALSNNVGSAAYLVNVNQGRLNGIMPASYTHTVTGYSRGNPITIVANINYSFYSATDQAQYNALQAEQSAASGMVSSVYAALAASLGAIGATAGYSSARIAGISENLVAGGLGDFLVAGGAGAHLLIGGAGRDLFAFGSWNDTSTSSLQSFQAGLQGDRLLVVPAGSRTIFVNSDAGGNTLMSYQIASGAYAQLQFTGTSLGALSLYDNIVGVESVSFANLSRGVSVSLASVTPRDYDGWTHVRNLTGSAYGDTLTGDQQSNIIIGGAGDDTLSGGAGDDMIYGGDGNDRILLEGQNDILSGGAGTDTFVMTRDTSFSFGNGLKNLIVDFSSAGGDKIDLSDFATASSFENLAYEVIQVDGVTSLRLYMGANPAGQYLVLKGVARSDLSHANFVYPPNQPPVAHDDTMAAHGVGPHVVSAALLLANDTDPDVNDGESVLSVSAMSAKGASVRLENGNVVYDPSNATALLALVEGQTTTDTFTYTMRDSAGATSTATVTMTVSGANDVPVAHDDVGAATEDVGLIALLAASLLGNDTDMDAGDTKSLLSVSANSAQGAAVRIVDGNVVYDPAALFQSLGAGQTTIDNFTYVMRDAAGLTSTATVRVTITGVNDGPIATDDAAETDQNTIAALMATSLLANDVDIDAGDTKQLFSVSDVSAKGASVSVVNGVVLYDPGEIFRHLGAGQSTTDTFTYTMRDAAGATSTATVTMTILGKNNSPVAMDDAASTTYDAPITIAVLANDADIDADDVLATLLVEGAQHGSVVRNADGTFTYTPGVGFTGTDSFTYSVADGHGGTSNATVALTVIPKTIGGNSGDDALSGGVGPDVLDGGIGNDTYLIDQSQDLIVENANAGIDTVQTTLSQYMLGANLENLTFTGSSAFRGTGNAASNVITGGSGNDWLAGGAGADILNGGEGVDLADYTASGAAVSIDLQAGTGLGGDAEADVLNSIENLAGSAYDDQLAGDDGANNLQGGSGADILTGRGGDDVIDGGAGRDTAVFSGNAADYIITVNGGVTTVTDTVVGRDGIDTLTRVELLRFADQTVVINATPVAHDDIGLAAQDRIEILSATALLANDTDEDAEDTKALVSVSAVSAKGASINIVDGNVVYDARTSAALQALGSDQTTTDTFTYTMRDTAGSTSMATVTMTVTGINDAPVAHDDIGTAIEDGGGVTLNVASLLGNDSDVDVGDSKLLVSVAAASAKGAEVSLVGGNLTYDPGALFQSLGVGQTTTDTFSYTMRDAAGLTSTATVTMTITGVNDAPVAGNDVATTSEDVAATLTAANLLANDSDVDADDVKVAVSVAATSAKGAVVSLVDGTVQYNPGILFQSLAAGQNTTDTFTYTMRDAAGTTSTAAVTVTITGTNDAPVAHDDVGTAVEDGGIVTLTAAILLGNDSDVDAGDSKALVSVATTSANGAAVSLVDGNVVYDPGTLFQNLAVGQMMTDTLTYTMRDAVGATSTATVMVIIAGRNDASGALADHFSMAEDGLLDLGAEMLTGNDADIDGDTLTVIAVGSAAHGIVTLDNGMIRFTAAGDYAGPGSFSYTVSDGHGSTATATVTIDITAVQDAPVAVADTLATKYQTTLQIAAAALLANDSDADVDVLTILSVDNAAHGTVMLLDGVITFTPTAGYEGAAGFDYTIDDGHGGTATAHVDITVAPNEQPPSAVNDAVTANEMEVLTIPVSSLLENDIDPNTGDSKAIVSVSETSGHGAKVRLAEGQVIYDPGALFRFLNSGEAIQDTFTYTMMDAAGLTSTAIVTVTIGGLYLSAVANSDLRTILHSQVGILPFTDNDNISAVGGPHWTIATGAQYGVVSVNPGNAWQAYYVPNGTFQGMDYFTYNLWGADGVVSTTTVTVEVLGRSISGTAGHDYLTGDARPDLFVGSTGQDTYFGQSGVDVIDYSSSIFTKVFVDLLGGGVAKYFLSGYSNDYLHSIENVRGSSGNDGIYGDSNDNQIFGGDGDDHIYCDYLNGGGYDYIDGGDGNDYIVDALGSGVLLGGNGDDVIDAGDGNYVVEGSDGNDVMTVWNGQSRVYGGDGDDTIYAFGYSELDSFILEGGDGRDLINASGEGRMRLDGGRGDGDILEGGNANSTYVFGRSYGHDFIDNSVDPSIRNAAGGSIEFAQLRGQLWFDRNGDDLEIRVLGSQDHLSVVDWYTNEAQRVSSMTAAGGYILSNSAVTQLVNAMATFEAEYASSHAGIAFDPTSTSSALISDQAVVAAIRNAWQPAA